MNEPGEFVELGEAVELVAVPLLPYERFGTEIVAAINNGETLLAYFAGPAGEQGEGDLQLMALLANRGTWRALRSRPGSGFASLTPQCPQLHLFERELVETHGLSIEGHPWLKPVRFPSGSGRGSGPFAGDMPFYQVEGEDIHEVAVGPVHAGVIEPGHFRFQCYGEKVLHLEISLGYQHRGVEELLPATRPAAVHALVETIAGDTSIGHMTAYCRVLEALTGIQAPPRARVIRAIALELERLANHVGDIGALALDIGFLPTASYCGRLRGDYLNMTALLCGSRFGRGLVRPGGVLFDITPEIARELLDRLTVVAEHTRGALELFFESPSVLGRLEGVGVVKRTDAEALGLVGVAGRACGVDCDVRRRCPEPGDADIAIPPIVEAGGDVFARAAVRRREIEFSLEQVAALLARLPAGGLSARLPADLVPSSLAVSMVEGWRGRIVHAALTDATGALQQYKIVDPSFFNWSGLAMALRDEWISDFPLCNKSFNLSYCGFDL